MKQILREGTVKRIHVDKRIIGANVKHGRNDPWWTIQTSKGSIKCHWWEVVGVCQGDQSKKRLSCGARAYIETWSEVHYR